MRFLARYGVAAFGLTGGLFTVLAADQGAAPPPAEIRQEVERLGSDEFSAREAAFERLLDLGVSSPEAVMAALPAESPDPDLQKRYDHLRRRIPLEPLLRKTLASLGKKDEKVRQAVTAFVDAPSSATLGALNAVSKRLKNLAEIIEPFHTHEDPLFRKGFLHVLYACNPERGVRFAMDKRTDPDVFVRTTSLNLLVKGLGKKASPLLLKSLLEDPARDVRIQAITHLLDLGDPSTASDLRLFVKNQFADQTKRDRTLVVNALCALAKMKDRESAPLFASLADEFDLLVRATAVRGLGELGDKRQAATVARHLESPEAFIQNAAACGMARLSEEPALTTACKDQIAMCLETQVFYFLGKEEDLQLGGGAEGTLPAEEAIAAVKTWWEKHKGGPEYAQDH